MIETLTSLTLEQILFMVATTSGGMLWAVGLVVPVAVLCKYGWMRFVHSRDTMQCREVPPLSLTHFSLVMVIINTALWQLFYLIVRQLPIAAQIDQTWYTVFCFMGGAVFAGHVGSAWLRYPVLPTSLVSRGSVFIWSFSYLVLGGVFMVSTLIPSLLGGG